MFGLLQKTAAFPLILSLSLSGFFIASSLYLKKHHALAETSEPNTTALTNTQGPNCAYTTDNDIENKLNTPFADEEIYFVGCGGFF